MTKLDLILDQIEARKVVLDREQVVGWLFEYATLYREKYAPRRRIHTIMERKALHILTTADQIYWKFDRPFKLELYDRRKMANAAQQDYKKGRV